MNAETRSGDPSLARSNKLDLLERIADDLAHEIKNPLHSMVINLEVLKRRVARSGASDTDDLLKYVEVLDGELDRVNRRVELLLRVMRPGRGREPVPLQDVVLEVLEVVELDCRRRHIRLEYEPDALATRVRVPLALGYQTLLNVVLGTLDTVPDGGSVRVGVERSDHELDLLVRGAAGTDGEGGSERSEGDDGLALLEMLSEPLGARVRTLDSAGPLSFALTFPLERG